MKRIQAALTLAVLATSVFAAAAFAATDKFEIDPTHSQAGFTVRHFFSRVPGRFNELSGTIQFDPKNLAASSVEVTIPVSSINTENDRRDAHLKSPDFFDAANFPNLTFKSTKVVPGKDGKFQIEGDLTMRGVTKKVVLDATSLGSGPVGSGDRIETRAGWEAVTTVNRKDYGISWNKTLDQGGTLLGDDVTITLQVEAIKAAATADAAK